jgi:hypothetical protein
MSGLRAAANGLPRPSPPLPSRGRLRGPRERSRSSLESTRDPRLGRTDAGLARRLPFTGMPSASTPVCGLHHTRQSHSRRRVAFQDDEVLERQFHVAGAGQWLRSPPIHSASATFGAKLPRGPNGEPSEDAAWLASATHPKPLHTHGLADSQPRRIARRGRAARRSSGSSDCSLGPNRTAHAGGDSSRDVPRPESECG